MSRRRVVLLGSTGSIGTQALDVVAAHPDRFEVVGLAAGSDDTTLVAQAREHGVADLALADADAARRAREALPDARVRDGAAGVAELAAHADADLVVNGITGARGLEPTLAALAEGTPVALANKESLIVGGDLVVAAAERAGGRASHLVPVDSEHSALAQCLRAGAEREVGRLVLTASGGPFRGRSREELAAVTVAEALAHPTWSMGPVITVNSATLMNKGLELIEAHLLFDVPWDRLDVVVHPQSVVHSMVEFVDGSTIAQLSPPDMRLPIQLAMAWPERLEHAFVACDWTRAAELTFEPVDRDTFVALDLAEEVGRRRGTAPAVLNAANEQAVTAFLDGRLGFLQVAEVVADVVEEHASTGAGTPNDLQDVLDADAWARRAADARIRARTPVPTHAPPGGTTAGAP
ncbi:MAG: 1-deoxy-D-xylulose-5-phosphate reductoisomerase [Actinomycetes bacterium]